MKKMKLFFSLIMGIIFYLPSSAYDFEIDKIYYTITSLTDFTVEVAGTAYTGQYEISIPSHVEYKEKTLTVTGIGSNAFAGDTLINCSLPSTLLYIGEESFKNCNITALTIPSSVRSLGSGVFSYSTISEVQIPEEVRSLPNSCFAYCKNLKNIILPKNLQSFGDYAFAYTGYSSLSFPDQLTSMGSYAIAGCNISIINLPSSLTSIGTGCLSQNPFEFIKIPRSITSIPDKCFMGCSNLTEIEFPNNLHSIGNYAFMDCSSLVYIDLPNSIKEIDSSLFEGCTSLRKVNIPDNVSSISTYLFHSTPNLESITFGSSLLGLPFNYYYERDSNLPNKYSKDVSDIGDFYHHYYNPYNWGPIINNETYNSYLNNIKEIIITDSPSNFSIKGFYVKDKALPAFCHDSSSTLEYFYTGRPLIDIKSFLSDNTHISFPIELPQGFGRIKKLEISGTCKDIPYFYQKIDTLILGSNITRVNWNNLYIKELKEIVCKNVTPPAVSYIPDFTTQQYTDIIIYVPYGSKKKYQEDAFWGNFWNIKELSEIFAMEVTLNKTSISLKKNETFQLAATVSPEDTTDKTVVWTSNNKTIASVSSNGLITANGVGNTQIVASCGEVSSVCEVTVTPILAEKITLNENSISLAKGNTFQLVTTIDPEDVTDKTILWGSDNKNVAFVSDNGLVTAVEVGNAKITASCGDVSATCEVIVTDIDGVDYIINEEEQIHVYTVNGILIKEDIQTKELDNLDPGIYIIQTPKGSFKIQK